MARTLHQAMAYLGLTDNNGSRSGQPAARQPREVHETAHYDTDDVYYTYDEDPDTVVAGAHFASTEERDVLLGIVNEGSSRSSTSYRAEEDYSEPLVLPVAERAPSREVEEETYHPLRQDHEPDYRTISSPQTSSYTSDESENELRRITTIHPRSYNDAKIIGESFRDNIPVIMNVTDMGDTEAKRLVDFSAGLAFALHGSIERVTDKVFLLTPANLEVLGAEGSEVPIALDSDDAGLFNQG